MTNTKRPNQRGFLCLGIVTAAGVCLAGFCPASIKKPDHKIGKVIEGTYKFNDGVLTGCLTLNDGQYVFIPEGDEIPKEIIDRFSFVKYPKGSYSIEYFDSVSGDMLLEDLGDGIFALIVFEPQEANVSESQPFFARKFCLMSCEAARSLCFHSSISETHMWSVTKGWD